VPTGGRGKAEGIGSKNDGNLKLLLPSPRRQICSMNPKQNGREAKLFPNLEAFLLVDRIGLKKPNFYEVFKGPWRVL
jgi:hypothetical protein